MAEWLSRWPRDPRKQKVGYAMDKVASGPLARRGSSPFPGATNVKLDKLPASRLFGLSKDFAVVVIANVLESSFK